MQFTGIDDFDMQLKKYLNTLISEIATASESTMAEARDTLKEKILSEVESDAAYKPKVYKRRSEGSGRGTPLSDMNAYSKIIAPAGGNVNGNLQVRTSLYYNPQGGHKVKKWHTADYNDLIGRIEKKNPPYTWEPKNGAIPPRPFWQHFIDEMVGKKELEKAFVWALKASEETVVADGAIVEDTHDREY